MKFVRICSMGIATAITLLSAANCYVNSADIDNVVRISKKSEFEKETVSLLKQKDVPEAIDYEMVKEKGHFERAKDKEEKLNTLVFNNTDGTQSQYIFNYPVKYIDESGEIRDKSMLIEANDDNTEFSATSSDIDAVFNKDLSDGIELKYEDVNVKMIPSFASGNESGKLSKDHQKVNYKCSDDISLEYSLTYQGIKENIVLDEYSGKNRFAFTLYTNGLTLKEDELNHLNLYNVDNTSVANIGDIIVYDSEQKNSIGTIEYKTVKESNEYILTVSVDDSFLKDSTIKYPVYIDPTMEIIRNSYH